MIYSQGSRKHVSGSTGRKTWRSSDPGRRQNGYSAKEIEDISGFTHGVGWCAPQQGACKLSLNVKEWYHRGSSC